MNSEQEDEKVNAELNESLRKVEINKRVRETAVTRVQGSL